MSVYAVPMTGQAFVDKMNEIRPRVASGAWYSDPGPLPSRIWTETDQT